jgi:hypothetical protein
VDGWLAQQIKVSAKGFAVEWSEDEAYVPMPRPGGDAWLRVDLKEGSGRVREDRPGLDLLLNDLHKGRNTGGAWSLFIDVFAIGCLVFCITGLLILKMHAQRRMTWPMVGLGLVLPALLVLLPCIEPRNFVKEEKMAKRIFKTTVALSAVVGLPAIAGGMNVAVTVPRCRWPNTTSPMLPCGGKG